MVDQQTALGLFGICWFHWRDSRAWPELSHLESLDGAGAMLRTGRGGRFSTCPGFLSHLSTEPESDKTLFWQMWRRRARLRLGGTKGKYRRDRTTDTFKNGQPCRVMREPDRIARQAGILPSVIKRHISQLEDFHFLVRGVKASGLENNKRPNKRPKRGEKGTMSEGFWKEKGWWRSVLLRHPTPSAPRSTTESPLQRTPSGRALQYLLVEELVRLSLPCWTTHCCWTPSPHQIPQSHLYMQEMGNMENSTAEQDALTQDKQQEVWET